jgi:hypothetical protein
MKKLLVVLCALALCSCEVKTMQEELLIDVHKPDNEYSYAMRNIPIDSFYVDARLNVHFFGPTHYGLAPLKDCYIRKD